MRWTKLLMVTAGATLFAGLVDVTPAAAYDYPWCAQGGELDYPGECAYQTYAQCQASVSGRFLYCGPNPYVAYGQVPQPQPRRRVRHHSSH